MHGGARPPETVRDTEADEHRFWVLLMELVEAAILTAIRDYERGTDSFVGMVEVGEAAPELLFTGGE